MSLQLWFRPPRNLLVLFLGTTLAFLTGLGWIAQKSLQLDRESEQQRIMARLNSAATSISAQIGNGVSDVEAQLDQFSDLPSDALNEAVSTYTATLGDGVVVVVFESEGVRAFPRRALLYYPVLPAADQPYIRTVMPPALEAVGAEATAAAMIYFKDMASSDDRQVHAEGLLGLAGQELKAGREQAALASYGQVRDPDVLVDGRPAELVARVLRCQLLKTVGRREESRDEARRLDRDLHGGRWQLTHAAYENYVGQVRGLIGESADVDEASRAIPLSIAAAVDFLWEGWRKPRGQSEMFEGREIRTLHDQPLFLTWRAAQQRAVALVASTTFLQKRFLEPVASDVHVTLLDRERRPVVSAGAAPVDELELLKLMQETDLPWALRVLNASPTLDKTQLAYQQQLLIAGIVLLALIVVAGTYFSARAMTREMNAARLQSDFVAAVSHEFRTPLTLLRQFSDMLADGRVSNDDERRMYYGALQRGTRRLTRLVEDLLDFARIEAGSRAFRLERLSAREWLASVVAEFDQESRNKGYHVELAWKGPADAVVLADDAALGRALWNLLDNAVKYSPGCKTIWVDGECAVHTVSIRVRDRGLGIPKGEHRAIFRKFVRGSTGNGHVTKGTGLGLTLVEQIVEAHGGTVRVDSTVGEGSTFVIQMPAQGDEQEQRTWPTS